jgi:hypothetical protein
MDNMTDAQSGFRGRDRFPIAAGEDVIYIHFRMRTFLLPARALPEKDEIAGLAEARSKIARSALSLDFMGLCSAPWSRR